MEYVAIESINEWEIDDVYDIWNYADDCLDGEGNFVIDDLVVHNCIPEYVKRRDDPSQSWVHDEHPIMAELLKATMGLLVFQEDLTRVWMHVAGFTAITSQVARKAVAKKWKEKLKPIRQMWIDGATPIIGNSEAIRWWDDRMEPFGRYAFNKCLGKDTILTDSITGESKTVEDWYHSNYKPTLKSYKNGEIIDDTCLNIHYNGKQNVYHVTFDNGHSMNVTLDHQILCEDGSFHTIDEAFTNKLSVNTT